MANRASRDSLYEQMLARALYLLSMREHGAKELAQKLKQKFPDSAQQPGLVEDVIKTCRVNNWQSDARFVESYVRMAREKGQGALKIRQALQSRCDQIELIAEALDLNDQDWLLEARAALEKKYGDASKPKEQKDFAKRLRFLQSRGYSASQCYKAFDG